VAPGIGGNKVFFTYMQDYEGLANLPIEKKYKSDQIGWYMRKLLAHLDQRPFTEKQPAKDWNERFERTKNAMKSLLPSKSDSSSKASIPQSDSSALK
jgi:hypothetical protein